MARHHPGQFCRPPRQIRNLVGAGDNVNVSNCRECFWVKVTHRTDEDILTGVVESDLFVTPLKSGELIRFHIDNVWEAELNGGPR